MSVLAEEVEVATRGRAYLATLRPRVKEPRVQRLLDVYDVSLGVTDPEERFTRLKAIVDAIADPETRHSELYSLYNERGDLVKLLWFDGDGVCLYAKRLERGRFVWPQAAGGSVALSAAQLAMLLEGIDWRRPVRARVPELAA